MDPNENIRQRITLLKKTGGLTEEEQEQYVVLVHAYNEWVNKGGFPADPELIDELRKVVTDYFATTERN